jgi:hypothetical protein
MVSRYFFKYQIMDFHQKIVFLLVQRIPLQDGTITVLINLSKKNEVWRQIISPVL